jgi:DNA-binding NarL/FixJ family response regulator
MIQLRILLTETKGPEVLSSDQLELVKHVVDGMEMKEISYEMGLLNRSAFDTLLRKTLDQIGVKNKRELVIWAVEHKIINDPPLNLDIHKLLTDQQAFILLSILRGVSEHEISKELNISVNTVKRYLEDLMTKKFKLKPSRKTQLIRFALRVGWSPHTTIEQMQKERRRKLYSTSGLSHEDAKIVSYILHGHSMPEIESKTGIKHDKMQDHFDQFRKTHGIKNSVELVKWGREHNLLTDNPIYVDLSKKISQEQFQIWFLTMQGLSDQQITDKLKIHNSWLRKQRKHILKKFNADPPNLMRLIRLGFQIGLAEKAKPGSDLPNRAEITPTSFPIVPSKFKPFEPAGDRQLKFQKAKDRLTGALYTLGIHPSKIFGQPIKSRPANEIWDLLSLAKTRYEYETRHGHPDRFTNPEQKAKAEKRMAQVNYAWGLAQQFFKRLGFALD